MYLLGPGEGALLSVMWMWVAAQVGVSKSVRESVRTQEQAAPWEPAVTKGKGSLYLLFREKHMHRRVIQLTTI